MTNLKSAPQVTFEQIKEVDEDGNEFWGARKLSKALEYTDFRNFYDVIERANLADAAKDAGVINAIDYAIFQNHGYKGLYGGFDAKAIHTNKGLKKSESILDHMGSTELAANLFRATQTEDKLIRDHVKGKSKANKTHYDVGVKVRKTIQEIGGIMPENLPVEDSIKKLNPPQIRKQ